MSTQPSLHGAICFSFQLTFRLSNGKKYRAMRYLAAPDLIAVCERVSQFSEELAKGGVTCLLDVSSIKQIERGVP